MENPWRNLSAISPQREDGNRQINSAVFAALIRAKLPTAEMSCVLFIIDRTWGFNKTVDAISISQFIKATGFTDRTIYAAKNSLMAKRIIYYEPGSPNRYLFNKFYDTWGVKSPSGVNSPSGVKQTSGDEADFRERVKETSVPPLKCTSDTIESLFIENNKENIYPVKPEEPKNSSESTLPETSIQYFCSEFIEYISKTFGNRSPRPTEAFVKKSIKTVSELIRIDGFDFEYISEAVTWAAVDDFWNDKILSLAGLRKKSTGSDLTKFQKIANSYERSKHKQISGRSMSNAQACYDFINEGRRKGGTNQPSRSESNKAACASFVDRMLKKQKEEERAARKPDSVLGYSGDYSPEKCIF